MYLFVDGVAERLRPGAATGSGAVPRGPSTRKGKKILLAPRTRYEGGHGELPRLLRGIFVGADSEIRCSW